MQSIATISNNDSLKDVKKVGIIYSDVKREYFPTEEQYLTEKDAHEDAELVAARLTTLGFKVMLYPGNDSLIENLKKDKPDVVFNLVDSIKGNEYLSSTIPGILDTMDLPYVGAGLLGLALCYNKFLMRKLLRNAGIPVPNFQLFNTPSNALDVELRFPVISKLNEIHGGVEIGYDAISEDEKHLRERVKFLISTYNQPVLIEEFISGDEITVMCLEGANTKIYMAKKAFKNAENKYAMATFEDQWLDVGTDKSNWAYTYEKYEDDKLKDLAKKAFELSKMEGYGKFDVRIDSSGRYYFIDFNANPAFGPKELNTAIGLIIEELHGVPFSDILMRLIRSGLSDAFEQNGGKLV